MSAYEYDYNTLRLLQLQREAESQAQNARLAGVAVALEGKFALVREYDALQLIYILSADCLLSPGTKRLTAFDIHVAAAVYTRSRSTQYTISNSWKSFVGYDIVAVFTRSGNNHPLSAALPATPSFARPQAAPAPQTFSPPASWLTVIDSLEARADEQGGYEALRSIFADDHTIASLLVVPPPAPQAMFKSYCGSRRSSLAAVVPRLSVGH